MDDETVAKRKTIQIACNQFGLFGLADDGTVWTLVPDTTSRQWGAWERLPELPGTDEAEAAQKIACKGDRKTLFGIPLPRNFGNE